MGSDHPNALDFSDLCRLKNSIASLARRASGDCRLLDAKTRLCKVYDKRTSPRRLHSQVGPRPNFYPYGVKVQSH